MNSLQNHTSITDRNTKLLLQHCKRITQKAARAQSKSRSWFQYRAGWIIGSHFRQVLHTNPHQPFHKPLKLLIS